ncbi:MAG: helix-turn-helix transcriptional regulator, partial [Chloroflexi bacterium]|nr:helix-turn-helix transcriptional regulator [Chloroflexota bacterium]
MASTRSATARRAADRLHRGLGEDVRRLREDASLTRAALAQATGVDLTYLGRIEEGLVRPSLEMYARLAAGLGADLVTRLYPNTGPTIRDRHQARILEWLLGLVHRRWRPYTEAAVRSPARGWIDLVLHDATAACLVATEIQSGLSRLEQLVRWSGEKRVSLPSWEGYAQLGPIETTSSLLLVRATRATRAIGRQFARQLEAA